MCNTAENPETLLVCDHCNFKVCHTRCLDEPITWIPEEDYYCRECCSRFNLKNSFAPPQEFNVELYEQIRNTAQPSGQTEHRQSNRRRVRVRIGHIDSEDELDESKDIEEVIERSQRERRNSRMVDGPTRRRLRRENAIENQQAIVDTIYDIDG